MISLLTDFGQKDGYVGTMKGVIHGICPNAQVIDLSHDIPPQDVQAAGFVLWRSYRFFPKGTIFVCVVDPGVGSDRHILAVQTADYTFIAPENGLLDFVLSQERIRQMLYVENPAVMNSAISQTFHGRDIFAPVAAHLASGFVFTQLGPLAHFQLPPDPFITLSPSGNYEGKIIYTDHFGNLITNIRLEKGENQVKRIRVGNREIGGLVKSYAAVAEGEILAIRGSHGLLEIAIRNGSAEAVLGKEMRIRIDVT